MSSFDILSFSDRLDWSSPSRGRQQLLLRFARERKVLNFNPLWEWRQAYKHPTKLYKVQDNLWHFEWGRLFPFFPRPRVAVRTTAFLRGLCVRWLCSHIGIEEHVYPVWNPVQAPVVRWLPRRFTVYYAYDQFDTFLHERQEWQQETLRNEELMARISHIAFGVSEVIRDSLKKKGFRRAYYCPNGVDYERFVRADLSWVVQELDGIPRPRLCYVGGLYQSTDYTTLLWIAETRTTWSIVLIGVVNQTMSDEKRRQVATLLQLPNVFHLGPRPSDMVPHYMAGMDAGLAVYDVKTSTYFGSSLKTYEYLAAGLPVVATPIPEVLKMGDLVYTAASPDEWICQIERALREDSPDLRRKRQEFAKQHSWDNRARQVMEIIEQAYSEWRIGQG